MISGILFGLAGLLLLIGLIDEFIVGVRSRSLMQFVLKDLPHKPPENKEQVTELFNAISA